MVDTTQTKAAETSRNQGKPNERKPNQLRRLSSTLVDRYNLAQAAGIDGQQFGGRRNLYNVFGYKPDAVFSDFYNKYERQDIARRIVNAAAKATWKEGVELDAAEPIQTAWEKMTFELNLYQQFQRVDRLCALGHFALLLLGFDDTDNLEKPLTSASQLLYTRPLAEPSVGGATLSANVRDVRFGKPEFYDINIRSDLNQKEFLAKVVSQTTPGDTTGPFKRTIRVHHSRILHCTEDPLEDDLYSTPIMEQVYNLLDDLLKVNGGSAEMFWLVGNRGIQADIDPEIDFDPEDAKQLEAEIDDYMHQLRRFMRTRGVKINTLDNTVANPKPTFDNIISLLSGATGLPRRVLLGAEGGSVASEQDRASWAERIEERRLLFAETCILRPLFERLQGVGIIPAGDVRFKWPSAFVLSPLEEGQMMAQKARAVGNLSRQIGNQEPMQLTSREEARNLIGLEGDLPDDEIFLREGNPTSPGVEPEPPEPEPRPVSDGEGNEPSELPTRERDNRLESGN